MSKKIERKDRKFKFETLQLHVGQESPDPYKSAAVEAGLHSISGWIQQKCTGYHHKI